MLYTTRIMTPPEHNGPDTTKPRFTLKRLAAILVFGAVTFFALTGGEAAVKIFEAWSKTTAGAAILTALFMAFLGFLFTGVTSTTEKDETKKRIHEAESQVQARPEKAKPAWDLARITLESYFNKNLTQIAWIFWLSLVVMIAGFGVIVWGVSHTVSLLHDPITESSSASIKVAPGVISTIAGLLTEFIGATFLFIYRSTIQQATNYSKTLERINSVGMAMQILDTMPEQTQAGDLKSATKAKLIEMLVRGAHEQKLQSQQSLLEPAK